MYLKSNRVKIKILTLKFNADEILLDVFFFIFMIVRHIKDFLMVSGGVCYFKFINTFFMTSR